MITQTKVSFRTRLWLIWNNFTAAIAHHLILKRGYISNASPRIKFIGLRPNQYDIDWIELKWGDGSMRIDIADKAIHINAHPLSIVWDACNAITINQEEPGAKT
jgi:hypothetical protein